MLRHRPRRETDADRQRADDRWTERVQAQGLRDAIEVEQMFPVPVRPEFAISVFDPSEPRPPASTGSWNEVWDRVDLKARPPAKPVGWGN